MTLPNFLVIGPGRSGTTSLHRYLDDHPQIYMSPVKEPGFLALAGRDVRVPAKWQGLSYTFTEPGPYQELFAGATNETALGESSANYFHLEGVIPAIKKYVPRAKLVVNLRNPIDRAYSGYLLRVGKGFETLSFEEAIAAEPRQPVTDLKWHFYERRLIRAGFHSVHLSRFLESFPREQVGIFFFDDLIADPLKWVRNIFRFLEVDDTFEPDLSVRHTASRIPRNQTLERFQQQPNLLKTLARSVTPPPLRKPIARALQRSNAVAAPPFLPETRRKLIEIYRADIRRLQSLVGRDLSHWLEPDGSDQGPGDP